VRRLAALFEVILEIILLEPKFACNPIAQVKQRHRGVKCQPQVGGILYELRVIELHDLVIEFARCFNAFALLQV
jgi:hypothetical protein